MFQSRATQKRSKHRSLYITLTFSINTAELGGGVKCTQLHGINLRVHIGHWPPFGCGVLSLVREQACKRLSQVSNGLRLSFILVARAESLAKGVEGIGQGLGFAARQWEKAEGKFRSSLKLRLCLGSRVVSMNMRVRC